MSFKVKRIISLILAVLPVIYLVLCIFMTDFIIEHDLIIAMFTVTFILLAAALLSIFLLARCPKCHLPVTPISLIRHSKVCPYCHQPYDGPLTEATQNNDKGDIHLNM